MLNTFINTEVLWFAATRFLPLAIIWVAGLKFIRANEYSNAHVDWSHPRVEANRVKDSTEVALAFVVVATGLAAASCEYAKGVFPSNGYKVGMEICLVVLTLSFGWLSRDVIKTAHRKCILRNQWRLHRIEERHAEDEMIIFDRHFDNKFEPEWRNVVVMANGWFLPRNLVRFEDIKPDCEIIPFPTNPSGKPKN